ncbi:MAG TPA: hypothetical protein VD862_00085 [Candidatus Paceibacterota bacterium]|nr:hypothetical protein [Candidatus Paceibacterota bacterium]
MEPVQTGGDAARAVPGNAARSAKLNRDIFHAYDIRGIYGSDFDDQFAREIANKAVTHFGARTVLVARDGRVSSESLERLVITGVNQAGADAISIGLSTTPLFYWSVVTAQADLGIMITASHNPPAYNGFKVIRKDGTLVSGTKLGKVFDEEFVVSNGTGTTMTMETAAQYLDQVMAMAGPDPLNTSISANIPPLMEGHMGALCQQYGITLDRASRWHVHMDPDADRISFYEDGEKIPADCICALLADTLGATTVVHDLRFSRSVLEYWASKGIAAVASRVGRLNMAVNMREVDAQVGGETSGHFYFKPFFYLEAPEAVLLLVLRAMQTSGASLADLTAPYRKYFKSDEVSIPENGKWFQLRQRLKETYKDGKITENDGVTVEFTESDGTLSWWANLRPSNTEPVLRLIVEAKSKDLLQEKVSEIRYLLQ